MIITVSASRKNLTYAAPVISITLELLYIRRRLLFSSSRHQKGIYSPKNPIHYNQQPAVHRIIINLPSKPTKLIKNSPLRVSNTNTDFYRPFTFLPNSHQSSTLQKFRSSRPHSKWETTLTNTFTTTNHALHQHVRPIMTHIIAASASSASMIMAEHVAVLVTRCSG